MCKHRQHVGGFTGVVACGLAAAGCATTPPSPQPLLFWPAPPARPRVQFLTWASGAAQIEPERGGFERFVLGDDPVLERGINKPYGIAVRDGVAYVCDTKALCVARLDFKNAKYSVFGGRGPGRLRKPINIAIGPLGYKFVVDPVRKQVVVFDPADKYVKAYDIPEPCHPVDVSLYQNEIYVLDNDDTCQVVVLDRATGDVIRTFGGPGGAPGEFKIPNSLCVGPDGFLYVTDTHNWRIQKLTRTGDPVWTKGAPGYTLGRFGRPRGIRVAPDGIIYVVDGSTEIVQMFDPDGQTLMRFAGPGNIPGALGLPSTIAIDRSSLPYFKQYIHEDFDAEYLLFVVSQFGRHLVNVYAFGAFPEGYRLGESELGELPSIDMSEGIGPVDDEQTGEPDGGDPSRRGHPQAAPDGEHTGAADNTHSGTRNGTRTERRP